MNSTIEKPLSANDMNEVVAQMQSTQVTIDRPAVHFNQNKWIRAAILAAGDLLSVVVSFFLALFLSTIVRSYLAYPAPRQLIPEESLVILMVVPVLSIIWFSFSWGHYIRIKPFWTEARELGKMVVYAGIISVFLNFSIKGDVSRLWLILSMMFLLGLTPVVRLLAKSTLMKLNRWFVPLIVVGSGDCIRDSVKAIESDSSLGYRVVARVEVDNNLMWTPVHREDVAQNLMTLAAQYQRPRLLMAFDQSNLLDSQEALVDDVSSRFYQVIIGRPMQGLSGVDAEILAIEKYDTLFIRLSLNQNDVFGRIIKRVFDIGASIIALCLLSPILLVISLVVMSQRGPVFYGSERIGLRGDRFSCLKFRTMRVDADLRLAKMLESDKDAAAEWYSTFKLRQDPRITRLGSFLRRTSLDELPQFWNVLVGDMSLVGPRPILPGEVENYGSSAIALYKSVRPGLTGLWQISGRSDLPYSERIALNQWYLRNWSHWLDLSILIRTLPALIGKDEAR